jgi:hypothetical protein
MPSVKRTLVGGARQVMEDDAWTDGHVVCTYGFWMSLSEDGRTGYLQLGLEDDSIFHMLDSQERHLEILNSMPHLIKLYLAFL